MSVPRVSILLPARDAAATLGACLASILRQTEPAWECVLVDDGSRDGTAGVAEAAARHDGRIVVVRTPPRGLVAALNEGLDRCRAPLIARMDADDVMHRARLALQAEGLDRSPDLSAVGCHVRIFPRRGLPGRRREYEAWLNSLRSADDVERDAFVECPVAHPALMMRREALMDGYRENGWAEDYDLVLRMLTSGRRIGMVARRLLAWRAGAGTLSRVDARYGLDRFTACKAHFLVERFLRGTTTYVLWGYGATGRSLRRALAALGRLPSHIVEVKAGRLGQRIHGAPVIRPEDLPALPRTPIVVSVARQGPRSEIRAAMAAMGFVEGRDFVCAA